MNLSSLFAYNFHILALASLIATHLCSAMDEQFLSFEEQEAALEKKDAQTVLPAPYHWQKTPQISTISYPERDNNQALALAAKSIEKMKKGDSFYGLYFLITHTEFLKTLAKKHAEGANINLLCCGSQKDKVLNALKLAKLDSKKVPIQFYNENEFSTNTFAQKLHTKAMAWSFMGDNEERQYRVYSGSPNISNMVNREMAEYIVDKERHDVIKELFEMVTQINNGNKQNSAIQSYKNPVLTSTPPDKTIISSLNYNLNKSIANIMQRCQEGDSCYINMYSWDDKATQDAVRQLANKKIVKLVTVDKAALKKEQTQKFLIELYEQGVPVHVFNYDETYKTGKFAQLNHIKGFARITKNNSHFVLGFGSNNWTHANNNDINIMHFDIDKTKTEEFIENCKSIAAQSKPLNFIVSGLSNNSNKRKLFETYNPEAAIFNAHTLLDGFEIEAPTMEDFKHLYKLFDKTKSELEQYCTELPDTEKKSFKDRLYAINKQQVEALQTLKNEKK